MNNQSSSTSVFNSHQGMTLIEVMIAIVLLSFVILGVTSITEDSQNAKDRTVQTDRDNMQIETVMSRLDWDISQAYSPLFYSQRFQGSLDPQSAPALAEMMDLYENNPRFRMPSKEGLPIPILRSREKTEFIFLTTGNRRKLENQKQSNFMWVRYYLGETPRMEGDVPVEANAEGTTSKSLLRQVFAEDVWSKEDLDFEGVRSSSLLDNVESMEFQFWNMATKKWESNLKTIQDGEHLVRGVRFLITWFDGRGSKRTAERWFRPNWPRWVPNDQPAPAATGGAAGGATGGGSTAGADGGAAADGDEEATEGEDG